MAERSKAWVCSGSPAEIVGLNPAGGMDVCRSVVSVVCCQVEVSATGLRRADPSSSGVLPTVARPCV